VKLNAVVFFFFFGQFWGNLGKNPSHPQNVPVHLCLCWWFARNASWGNLSLSVGKVTSVFRLGTKTLIA